MAGIVLAARADCPYGERVRLVLEHLGLAYEMSEAASADRRAARRARRFPRRPVLRHEGHEIHGSNIITAYLDERFDGGLMPDPAGDRARVRMLGSHADLHWMPAYRRLVRARRLGPDREIEAALEAAQERLQAIEAHFSLDGPFLVGSAFTLADVAFATSIPRLDSHYACRVPRSMPRLRTWVGAVEALPAWQRIAGRPVDRPAAQR